MTLILEEPPVTSRPLGKAEKQDIMAETQAILARLKENAGGNLKEMISAESDPQPSSSFMPVSVLN